MKETREWVIILRKSNYFAKGLTLAEKVTRDYRDLDFDEVDVKYIKDGFITFDKDILSIWNLDNIKLEWVELEQKYVPSFKDKCLKFLFNKDYQTTVMVRPKDDSIVIADYGNNHYEVVEYGHNIWVTEFSFPIKPKRWSYFPDECLNAANSK